MIGLQWSRFSSKYKMKSSSCNCSGFPSDSLFNFRLVEAILLCEIRNRLASVEPRCNYCSGDSGSSDNGLAESHRRIDDNMLWLRCTSRARKRIKLKLPFVVLHAL